MPYEPPSPNNSLDIAETPSKSEVHWLVKAFASGLFSGFSPVASGTVGSAVALAIYFLPGFEQPVVILPVGFFTFLAGVRASHLMEQQYGHDPAEVTIDEVVGMWVSLLLLPKHILIAGCAFLLFRIFDIFKPFPARKFDNVLGGLGIMMDDVVAGLYTNLAMHLLIFLSLFEKLGVQLN
ncbi:MAG: phosphatidylglycerophosphatase A family protein [Bacteroidota bacterium]